MVVNTIQNESLSINSANYKFNDLLSNLSVTFNKKEQIPKNFNLINVYPNPFNPSTVISFDIAEMGDVSLKIFDLTGRQVASLINEFMIPGSHQMTWNPGLLPSGV